MLTTLLHLFSPRHQLAAALLERHVRARKFPPLTTYRAVIDIDTIVDPRALANLKATPGKHQDDAEDLARRVQVRLTHLISQTTRMEQISLGSIDGCTDSRDELETIPFRSLLEWGNTIDRSRVKAEKIYDPAREVDTCLEHSFPTHATKPIQISDLTWAAHPRYWHNSDGSHHAAYAIAKAAASGIQRRLCAAVTRYEVNDHIIASLVADYGAYVMNDMAWAEAMGPYLDAPYPIAFAQVNGRAAGAPNTTRIWFLDPQHKLTPTVREALDRLAENGCARTLDKWIDAFRI